VLIILFEHTSFRSFQQTYTPPFIMKTVYPLLTLLSASLVVGAPAPFVVSSDVAAGTGSAGLATRTLSRREDAVVADFAKRALQLRGAIVAARNNQKDDAAEANDAAEGKDAAADKEQAKDQGKEADAKASEFYNNKPQLCAGVVHELKLMMHVEDQEKEKAAAAAFS
jgi:hypothetical protein